MSRGWVRVLDSDGLVELQIDYSIEVRGVVNYSVVLTAIYDGRMETVRVYDGAHGQNEMHRYTQTGGKQPAEVFHRGTLGEGMRRASQDCVLGYAAMIEGWKR